MIITRLAWKNLKFLTLAIIEASLKQTIAGLSLKH